jgi:hypothetical protein
LRPKASEKSKTIHWKSVLFKRDTISHLEESAVVHYVQLNHLSLGDEVGMSDDYPAVVRTVEELSVVGNDNPTREQEKEARSVRGIPFQ